VPPEGVAVKPMVLPAHIPGSEEDIATVNEHDWLKPRSEISKKIKISRRIFINLNIYSFQLYDNKVRFE
jgi:hypothetical protein